jgi:integrase
MEDKAVSRIIDRARRIRGRRAVVAVHDDAIAFPEQLFTRFFLDGLDGAPDRRAAVRNQLIVLMMHFAGCRESDALHLWIEDVLVDPLNADSVIVRLYHPEDGQAPNGWRGRNDATNRAAYLREKYALTPRNKLTGTKRVGWKVKVVDHKDNYIQLHWFPRQAGVLFAKLWKEYLLYLVELDRAHPYAFVSFAPRSLGQPLTLNAFNDAYEKALLRIGETPAKIEGRSPHAHRHAMGRRLENAGIHPRIIQKALHHSSLSSQEPYTAPGIERVTQMLDAGYAVLEHKAETGGAVVSVPDWEALTRHGFEDIDPDGLFSGPDPKLGA